MTTVAENLATIGRRMRAACDRADRDPAGVRLVAVTKTVAVDRIREALAAGVTILGENYVQEARDKKAALADFPVSWHFIGHLQSNKANVAAELFDWIHSLDRESLARALDRAAQKRGRRIPVLIEVNLGDELTKSGIAPDHLLPLFRALQPLDGLWLRGLMALPPYCADQEAVRPYFQQLRLLFEQLRDAAPHPEELTELSMGMSHDFEVAIEEGATLVRIGTALFGERPAAKV
jgi:hypothetical protein